MAKPNDGSAQTLGGAPQVHQYGIPTPYPPRLPSHPPASAVPPPLGSPSPSYGIPIAAAANYPYQGINPLGNPYPGAPRGALASPAPVTIGLGTNAPYAAYPPPPNYVASDVGVRLIGLGPNLSPTARVLGSTPDGMVRGPDHVDRVEWNQQVATLVGGCFLIGLGLVFIIAFAASGLLDFFPEVVVGPSLLVLIGFAMSFAAKHLFLEFRRSQRTFRYEARRLVYP